MNQDQIKNQLQIAKWHLERVKEVINSIQEDETTEVLFQTYSYLAECECDLEMLYDYYANKQAQNKGD